MRNLLLVLLAFTCSLSMPAQSWQDTVNRIEKLFERYKPANPGAQLAISRNGQVIFSKAWGLADMEHNVPLTTVSPTEAGSVSKQFTAAAILLLEQEGKLSLNDDVRKYVPELPGYGEPVTLRQMMQHTSGLKDWGAVAAIAGWPRSTKTYSNDDAVYISSLQKTLNHRPGAEYLYSNSNYNLFAVIVQRVSGQSLADYTRKKIFEPAGMTNTQWRADHRKIVPNRAIAYSRSMSGYMTNMPNEMVYGNGGLLTTAEDLLKWTQYYSTGKLGNPSLLPKQLATHPLNNGAPNNYGAGLVVRKYHGTDLITHDGATAGYRANLDHFPSLGLTIAFLSNTSEFDGDATTIAEKVRQLFIKPVPGNTANTANAATITLTEAQLNRYAGWYRHGRSGAGIRAYVKDGQLTFTQVGATKPLAENIFAFGGNRVEFSAGKKGFLFITAANDSIYFPAMDTVNLAAPRWEQYEGEYYSAEAQATCFVKLKNGKPVLLQKPATEIALIPTFKDGFDMPGGNIVFERDKKNRITGFLYSTGRARNVSFTRK